MVSVVMEKYNASITVQDGSSRNGKTHVPIAKYTASATRHCLTVDCSSSTPWNGLDVRGISHRRSRFDDLELVVVSLVIILFGGIADRSLSNIDHG